MKFPTTLQFIDGLIILKALMLGLLMFIAISLVGQTNHLAQQSKIRTTQIKTLSQQIKDLSEENKSLNQQNQRHLDCLAQVFAQYTQDFLPVTIENLDKCTLANGVTGRASATSAATPPAERPPSSSDAPSPNLNTPSPKPKPNIVHPRSTISKVLNFINPFN